MENKGTFKDPLDRGGGTYANSVNGTYAQASGAALLHNMERWLTQREPDGATVPAITLTYGYNPSAPETSWGTDNDEMAIARTGAQIGFRLDDAMRFGVGYSPSQIAVKVTYYDDVNSAWTLRYTRSDGLTGAVTRAGTAPSGKVKTTTFFLTDFVNSSGAVNFRIDNAGANVKFMFVRVVRV
jgi:hypothetical protein